MDADSNAGAARALSAKDIARLRVRMLPYLMAKIDPGVSLSKCSFKVRPGQPPAARALRRLRVPTRLLPWMQVARSKMSTGRVVVCRQLRVAGAYTLETSLGGCSKTGLRLAPMAAVILLSFPVCGVFQSCVTCNHGRSSWAPRKSSE